MDNPTCNVLPLEEVKIESTMMKETKSKTIKINRLTGHSVGFSQEYCEKTRTWRARVEPEGLASRFGLRDKDRILSINGEQILFLEDMVDLRNPGASTMVEVAESLEWTESKKTKEDIKAILCGPDALKALKCILKDEESKEQVKQMIDSEIVFIAIEEGDADVAGLLMEQGDLDREGAYEDGLTFLMAACKQGLEDLSKKLLNAKTRKEEPVISRAHINLADVSGETALTYATEKAMGETCMELTRRGAKCDVVTKLVKSDQPEQGEKGTKGKWTPLMRACYRELPELIATLLDEVKHPEITTDHINIENYCGETSLEQAIGMRDMLNTKKLLSRGAVCGEGRTPLFVACYYSWKEGALELLSQIDGGCDNGKEIVDINAAQYDGKTALEWAISEKLGEVVVELLKRGASLQKEGSIKTLPIQCEDFKAYLDETVTIDKPDIIWQSKVEEKLVIDYTFLSRESKDNSQTLEAILNLSPGHRKLVKHPVIQAFLMVKWGDILPIWATWILVKLVFFLHIITFATLLFGISESHNFYSKTNSIENNTITATTGNPTKAENNNTTNSCPRTENFPSIAIAILNLTFAALTFLFSTVEALQMVSSLKAWTSERKNWMQLLILAICSYLIFEISTGTECSDLSRHFLGMLIPLTYYEFLYEVGYHPNFKKYINMFNRVVKTFSQYFVVYMGLIICFAGGYFIMLPHKENPSNAYPKSFWKLVPKVFVMFTGEQEFMNIPFETDDDKTVYKVWEMLFFLSFLMLTVIILLNLLNGLAVADAREMLDAAEADMLVSLVGTAAFWDEIMQKSEGHEATDKTNEISTREDGHVWNRNGELRSSEEDMGIEKVRASERDWWAKGGKLLDYHIPKCIQSLMSYKSVLSKAGNKFFFSINEGEQETYTAHADRKKTIETGFTLNQDLKNMMIDIIENRDRVQKENQERMALKVKEDKVMLLAEQERKEILQLLRKTQTTTK